MKLIDLDEIRGEEILARAIVNEEYQELLSEGAVLKKEHIFKLKEILLHKLQQQLKRIRRMFFHLKPEMQ